MTRISAAARTACAALIACVLAACGGGSGGGGGGSTSAPSAPPPPQFSVSPTSLSFLAASPSGPPTPLDQSLTVTVSGVDARSLFVRIVVNGTAVSSVDSFTTISSTQGRMGVRPAPTSSLGFGTHVNGVTLDLPELLGSEYSRGYCGSASGSERPALMSVNGGESTKGLSVTL